MDLSVLNDKQKEAVLYNEGPLLIVAGAGSGKTRVLTYKVAYLIENGINPLNILAITFTNKAAEEMKERIISLISGKNINGRPYVSTFHKFCGNILSKYFDRIGRDNRYTILDTEDQKKLMKNIIKDLFGEDCKLKEKGAMAKISYCKNHNISPDEYSKEAFTDIEKKIVRCFYEYNDRLCKMNAVDFDDMLLFAVEILKKDKNARDELNNRFKYILVDEYQDTNGVQFELIKLLTEKNHFITVVGDDDQSIYKFRGADITNILNFEENFSNAKVIKLTQNYRSTRQILDVANSIIKNNMGRKDKSLWCEKEDGSKVSYINYSNDFEEAKNVIENIKNNKTLKNTCILYRTNATSRKVEDMCVRYSIPYKIIGNVSFYKRKEVKDIISYLKLIANSKDDVSFSRIINVPKRGIGETSIKKIESFAKDKNISLYEAISQIDNIDLQKKAKNACIEFTKLIENLKRQNDVNNIISKILESGLEEEIRNNDDSDTATDRIQNINEIKSKFTAFKYTYLSNIDDEVEKELFNNNIEFVLDRFLYDISLVESTDELDINHEYLTLMTLHASKGLEYDNVYIIGLNEYLFPSEQSIREGNIEEIEEERRLMYVGTTRAKNNLYLSSAKYRMINGNTMPCERSRFVDEIDTDLIDIKDLSMTYSDGFGFSSFNNNISKFKKISFKNLEDEDNVSKKNIEKYLKNSNNDIYKKGKDIEKPDSLDYQVGDRVSHVKFGDGKVMKITDEKTDYEVTIDFDDYGEKILFARFAKLKKI